MHKRHIGFTIVELLIVIVVIAILASISIVAYNGIAKRAESTAVLAAFDAYEKGLRAYNALHGEYPSTRTGPNTSMYTCLGGTYPAITNLGENECLTIKSNSTTLPLTTKLQSVDDQLQSIMGSLPTVNYKEVITNQDGTTVYSRGIIYESVLNQPPLLMYYLPGEGECGRGVKYTDPNINISACRLELR